LTLIRGIPGAVDDVGDPWRNDIEDDRAMIWQALGATQGVLRGLTMSLDAGSLSVTFQAGCALLEERGVDITGDGRGYFVFEDTTFQVTFDSPDASSRNDAVVIAWSDPQYGVAGAAVDGPGPQVIVVKGVSGSTTPRTDSEINTGIGPGAWVRFADVIIAPGDTQVNPANVTTNPQASAATPWCKVYRSANVTLTHNVLTTLSWDAEDLDTHSLHSTSTNPSRVTITRAGRYRVTAQVAFLANATGQRTVIVNKNGATAHHVRHAATPTSAAVLVTTGTVLCAPGDYLEVQAQQTSGGNLDVSAAISNTWFEVEYVGSV